MTSQADSADATNPGAPNDAATVDVIVIGGGPVGENVAQYAIEDTDLTAALVEGELLGGECSYWACMPSKALLRPLDVRGAAANLTGISTPQVQPDELLARRDQWVSGYDDAGQEKWARAAGLQVVRGHGRLSGEREVTIAGADGDQVLRARRAVILATGSRPTIPETFAAVQPWTSRDATAVREIPGSVLIIGGGVVACEAATWLRALGSEVTLLVRGELLTNVEPSAADHVRKGLETAGVTVRTNTSVTSASRPEAADSGVGRIHGGPVTVQVTASGQSKDGQTEDLRADEVLVATGRRPRLSDVGLDQVGLEPQGVTDGRLPEWLYAVGDASGEAPLTHWGKYRARVIGSQIRAAALGTPAETPAPEPVNAGTAVPQVIFTDPQVAAVGRTEQQARDAGHEVVTAEVPYQGAAGSALLRDDVHGIAKIVVDAHTRRLLGATFAGPEAAEVVHAATVALVGQVPVDVLRHAVPSYPAVAELWLRLLEELPREYRHPAWPQVSLTPAT